MAFNKAFSDFLKKDKPNKKEYEVIISDRLKDFPFKIKPMNFEQYSKYQSDASKVKVGGKNSDTKFDSKKYYTLMIINHVIEPNFKEREFLDEVGYMTAEDFIVNELNIDEIYNLGEAIMDVSGISADFEKMVTEAKNS